MRASSVRPVPCTRPAGRLTFSPFSFSSVSLSDSLFSSVTRQKKKKGKKVANVNFSDARNVFYMG